MPPAIKTKNLTKKYGDLTALDSVSLEVDEGEFYGLLGPNGAGKTTFINILVGLARKTSGSAEVYGFDVEKNYKQARNKIGLAPQEFNVDRFFPIKEVLMHKAGYHGIPKSEREKRAEEVLREVGIYDKKDTRFHWLSGGMKRRFMLARAMVTHPDLLILDEPTAGVDVELRHDLWNVIRDLNEKGTSILLTTHYIEEAERLCDRVAILDRGNVVDIASPGEFTNRSHDRVYVTVRETPETKPEFSNGSIKDVKIDGDRLVFSVEKGSEAVPDIVRELDKKGVMISNIEVSPTSLEEIFVDITDTQGETTR